MAAIRGIKITAILISIFAALILAGCGGGGGGNSLSYVPQNMARDCSNGPSTARVAAATATVGFDAVQCIQIHQYGQTTPVLKGATLTVSSGSSLMLQALVYDFQCSNVTSSFTGDISWSLSTSALGSLSMSQDTATLAAGTPASDVSGTITVMLFNGSTMVKQDSINVVVKASNTPSAPTGLAATAGNTQVALTWTAPATNTDSSSITDLAGYNVYYGTSSGGPYTQANASTVSAANYTVTGLTNGTAYYFVVTAIDSESPVQESADSSEATATPSAAAAAATVPNAPTAVTPTAGSGQVALSWTAPTTNTDSSAITDLAGYNVYYSASPGGPYTQANGAVVAATNYTVTGLTNGILCYFVVRAVDNESPANESANSTEVSATPVAPATVPNAPTAVTPTAGATQVALTWTAPTNNTDASAITDLAGYNVYYGTASGGPYTQANVVTVAVSNYTVTGLTNGTTYYFVVQAIDNESPVNSSANSTETSATPVAVTTFKLYYGDGAAAYEIGSAVKQTSDGGYIATGFNLSGADAVYKLDSTGGTSWTYNFTGNGQDIIETSSGAFMLCGDNGSGTAMVEQITPAGVQNWAQTYAGISHCYGIIEVGVNYVFVGDDGSNGRMVFIDSSGTQTSAPSFDHTGNTNEFIHSINTVSGGGYILGGYTGDGSTNDDFWLIRTDAAGAQTWENVYNNRDFDHAKEAFETATGFAIGGYTVVNTYTDADMWLVFTDSSGTQTGAFTYGQVGTNDYCYGLTKTSDNGFLLTGPSESTGTTGLEDFWLVKTDSAGTEQWNRFFGTTGNEFSNAVDQTSDGGYAVLGGGQNGASYDYWLVKTDSSGLSP